MYKPKPEGSGLWNSRPSSDSKLPVDLGQVTSPPRASVSTLARGRSQAGFSYSITWITVARTVQQMPPPLPPVLLLPWERVLALVCVVL